MKRELALATLVITLAATGLAVSKQVSKSKAQPPAEKMTTANSLESETPFVCSLTALSRAEREHHSEVSKQLKASVKEVRELPDGYAFRLPGERETLAMAADWISLERLCCPFFSFQLEIGSDSRPIWLRLTGREGVKQFMQVEFGIK